MKKIVSLLMILSMLFAVGITKAEADTTDTFTITVTCNFIEIVLKDTPGTSDYTTWALGTVALSNVSTMTSGQGVRVVLGTTSQNVDIQSKGATSSPDSWTIAASAGSNVYKLICDGTNEAAVTDFSSATTLTTDYQDINNATATQADRYLYYKFTAPSTVSTGSQQTITISVQAIAS